MALFIFLGFVFKCLMSLCRNTADFCGLTLYQALWWVHSLVLLVFVDFSAFLPEQSCCPKTGTALRLQTTCLLFLFLALLRPVTSHTTLYSSSLFLISGINVQCFTIKHWVSCALWRCSLSGLEGSLRFLVGWMFGFLNHECVCIEFC